MTNNKVNLWQYLRGICILLVVLIHSKSGISYENSNQTWNFDYWLIMRSTINFPVAVFVFLSGYLMNIQTMERDSRSYVISRFKRLLIPFIVWSTIYSFINIIIYNGDFNLFRFVVKLILGLSSGQLYYILVLAQLTLLAPFLMKLIKCNKWNKIILSITPFYFVMLYIYVFLFEKQLYFYQTLFPAWLIYFYLGIWVSIKGFPIKISNKYYSSVSIFLTAIVFSIFETYLIKSLGLPLGFASSQIKISSLILSLAFLNLVFAVKENYIELHDHRILKYLGDNSYGIYYVHMIWIPISNKIISLIPNLDNMLPILQLLQVLLTIIFSILSIHIIKKLIGNNFANKFMGF